MSIYDTIMKVENDKIASFGKGNRWPQTLPANIDMFEEFLDVLLNQAQSPEVAFQWLEQYTANDQTCYAIEMTMKLLICFITPGKIPTHENILGDQPLDSLRIVLDAVANHYCIVINVVDSQGTSTNLHPINLGSYLILNIYNQHNSFCILYTQEAIDLEKDSNRIDLLSHPNIATPKPAGFKPTTASSNVPTGIPNANHAPVGMNPVGMTLVGMNPVGMNPVGMNPVGMNSSAMNPSAMNPGAIYQDTMNPGGMNPVGMNPGGNKLAGTNPGLMNLVGMNLGAMNPGGNKPAGMNPGGVNLGGINPVGMNPGAMNPVGMNLGAMNPMGMNPGSMNPVGNKPLGNNPVVMNHSGIPVGVNPVAMNLPKQGEPSKPINPKPAPPAEPPKPSKPKEIKYCTVCNKEKEKEEFELIECGVDFKCSVCSFCRKTNQEQCLSCKRFYSDYEQSMFSYF